MGPVVHPSDDIRIRRATWNDIDRGKLKNSEKTCPSAILSTINPMWIHSGVNPGLHCGQVSNLPSEPWHGHSALLVQERQRGRMVILAVLWLWDSCTSSI
jgi:hypothetical protein